MFKLKDVMKYKNTIVVNATALRSGGALTILRQFIDNIDVEIDNFIIFVDISVELNRVHNNIQIVKLNKTSMLARILWDRSGLNNWLKKNNVLPSLLISLQNTSVRLSSNCPKVIYLHQPLPFSTKCWSVFKKEEYKFFLYKKFYSYFIFRYVDSDTQFVVQTQWIKQALIHQYGILTEKVEVFKPDVCSVKMEDVETLDLVPGKKIIFYPATPIVYKNHAEIINAMIILKNKGIDLTGFNVCFTFLEQDSPNLSALVNCNGLGKNFSFLGPLSYSEVLAYYKASSLVVFPSYIETFGLPLIEAAAFKKPILVANEPYSREVLEGYRRAIFLDINQPAAWGDAIESVMNTSSEVADELNMQEPSITINDRAGWPDFFEFIKKLL